MNFRSYFISILAVLLGVVNTLAQTTFTSTGSGDWNDGATWGNTSPGSPGTDWPATTDNVVISSGHTVTLTGAETINDLTINSGGILDDDNTGNLTVDGNLVLNGTKTGQKNIQFTGGSGQTIDGTGVHNSSKDLVISGDASVLSTANLTVINNIEVASGVTVTNNGSVTINNNLKGLDASSTWINAANSTLKVAKNLLGSGILTATASGNTVVYNRTANQVIKTPSSSTYYNLTLEGTGNKTMLADLAISGSLTITSGTLDAGSNYDLTIGSDWSNSGTFNEQQGTVTLIGSGSQTVTNSSGETFYDLTINKSSGTLNLANDVTASNTLTMIAGTINTGSNTLTLGTGTGNEGTYSYTAGQIIGLFERWMANSTTSTDIDFPVGTSSNSRVATINFSGINVGGTVLFQFIESDPGNSGLSLVDGAVTVYNSFVDGYWDMSTANSFDLGGTNDFNLNLSGTGFTAFIIDANTRLLTRADAGSSWMAEGTHAPAVDPIAKRTGLSTMGAQYAFGDDTMCTGPTTSAITGSTEVCTSDAGVSYSVTDNSNTYTWTITGGTQVTGGTTASITIDWGITGQVGNVRVVETNGCTSGSPVDLSVNINSIAPTSVTGRTSVAGSTQDESYSVTDLWYTYTWTITGGTLDTGQGTSSITVDWGTSGVGNVSVVAQKSGCAAAAAFDIDVTKYLVINSAQTGNWGTASTWVTATVPLSTENARVLNTHTVTLTANETINNFIIDAGGTVTTTNKILTIDGDGTINGTYTGGSKELVFNGANSSIDGTGTISLNSGIAVEISSGNKTITSTAVLSITSGDLDIAAGITVTNNGSITVTEDILDQATSVWTNSNNSTLKAGAAVLANGTLNASATGNTVEYNTSGAQTIKNPASSTYYNLTLSGSGTKTAPATLDINGDLTISGTAELDISANNADLTIAGDYSNSGGTFTEGTQTVTLDGTSQTITSSGQAFFNLTLANSGTKTLGDALDVNGILTINNSVTLDVSISEFDINLAGDCTNNNGTFNERRGTVTFDGTTTITSTSTVDFYGVTITGILTAPSSDLNVAGDWDATGGTFNHNGGTINLIGSAQSISSGTNSFNNLTIAGAGIKTLQDALDVNGNLFITSTLSTGSGNNSINLAGDWGNDGTFTSGTGKVTIDGTLDQDIMGASTTSFVDIDINKTSGRVLVESNVNLTGTLDLLSATELDADGSGSGVLTIMSNASGDARIDELAASASITGNLTVQRFLPNADASRSWRYVTSSVTGATVSDWKNEVPITGTFNDPSTQAEWPAIPGINQNSPSMYRYTETLGGALNTRWESYPLNGTSSTAAALENGRGYAMYVRSSGTETLDIRGSANTGNIGVSVTSSGATVDDGWNLIGNLYPSSIDWDNVTIPAGVNNEIHFLDNANNAGTGAGSYVRYVAGVGTPGSYLGEIAMGQAFWIRATANATITFQEDDKITATGQFFKLSEPNNLLRIGITGTNGYDETVIRFLDEATDDFDPEYDAHQLKLANLSLYSWLSDGKLISINTLSQLTCEREINLGVDKTAPGNFTLNFFGFESFVDTVNITLVDHFSDISQNVMENSDYVFEVTTDPLSSGNERFSVIISLQIKTDIPVSNVDNVCDLDEFQITINDTQKAVAYQAFLNDLPISEIVIGNSSSVNLIVNSGDIAIGDNNLIIIADRENCNSASLDQNISIFKSENPSVSAVVDGSNCGKGTVNLQVSGASNNGFYRWYDTINSIDPIIETSDNTFETPIISNSRDYFVSVVNDLGCEGERVMVTATIDQIFEVITVNGGKICKEGTVILSVTGAPSDGSYRWYNSSNEVLQGSDSTFETASLLSSEIFHVSIISPEGCEGPTVEVLAVVVNVENPVISFQDDMLNSSSEVGNQWYLDGSLIPGAVDQTYLPKETGFYTVEVTIDGCTAISAEFEYLITGISGLEASIAVKIFPNPANGVINIEYHSSSNQDITIIIFDLSGKRMKEYKGLNPIDGKYRISTSDFEEGVYLIQLLDGDKNHINRVIVNN